MDKKNAKILALFLLGLVAVVLVGAASNPLSTYQRYVLELRHEGGNRFSGRFYRVVDYPNDQNTYGVAANIKLFVNIYPKRGGFVVGGTNSDWNGYFTIEADPVERWMFGIDPARIGMLYYSVRAYDVYMRPVWSNVVVVGGSSESQPTPTPTSTPTSTPTPKPTPTPIEIEFPASTNILATIKQWIQSFISWLSSLFG